MANEPIFDDSGAVVLEQPALATPRTTSPVPTVPVDPSRFLVLTNDESKALAAPVDPNEVQIKPNGIIYIPWESTARRLNEILGVGQWQLHQLQWHRELNLICMTALLFVRGNYVANCFGACEYVSTNSQMSLMDAVKGAYSDVVTNAGKALGVHLELWNPNFIRDWLAKYACKVWRRGLSRPVWRRKDAPPYDDEYTPPSSYTARPATQAATPATTPAATPATTPPPPNPSPPGKDKPLSLPQIRRLYAIAKANNVDRTALHLLLKQLYNVDQITQLSQAQYEHLCGTDDKPSYLQSHLSSLITERQVSQLCDYAQHIGISKADLGTIVHETFNVDSLNKLTRSQLAQLIGSNDVPGILHKFKPNPAN